MAGLVPGQRPGDVVQLGLIVREVRERDAGQQIVDPLLQHSPDGPDAARSLRTTSLGIDGMEIAVDFEGDVLRGLDHVLDGDDVGLTGEVVAALGTTNRVHQAGAPQAQENLLDVVVRQPLLLGELARRDRPLPRALREVHGDDQPVFGPGGDAHWVNMRERVPGFNGSGWNRQSSGSSSPPPAPRTRSPRSYAAATAGAR